MAVIRPFSSFAAILALGLALRLALAAAATPWTHAEWFAPFLESIANRPSLDPWTTFWAAGGEPMSFPYGPVYILIYGPFVWVGQALAGAVGGALGLRIAVIVLDGAVTVLIRRLAGERDRDLAAALYWLSPIVLYTNYWHGQLDVAPTLLLLLALDRLRAARFASGGFAMAAAIAAKFSMALAAPFAGLYLYGAGKFAAARVRALAALALGLLVCAPVLASPGFRAMVLGTPEVERLYALAIPVQAGIQLFALPVALLAFFYVCWRVRRFNFDMTLAAIGAAFLALTLLTPPTPGWTMWVMPFLVLHVVRTRGSALALGAAFSVFFLLFHLTVSTGARLFTGQDFTQPLDLGALGGARLHSAMYSLYFMLGAALLAQLLWRGIFIDRFYQATRRPLVIGIAGDSGAGKDTLADAIADLFDPAAVSKLSGDDYHNWDRNKPMWRAFTHLNPRSNDLERFDADVLALAAGRSVRARHYDHAVGAMTKPRAIPAREVVIASALHALYNPGVRAAYDLRIYLDMDEDLRRHFKVRRDVDERGHALEAVLESIDRRTVDAERYVRPQARAADAILSLARHAGEGAADALRLRARFPHGVDADGLTRALIAVAGLDVSERRRDDGVELTICGAPRAADVAAAARALAPDMDEFMALAPRWRSGMTGIMQLIVVRELARVARTRTLRA